MAKKEVRIVNKKEFKAQRKHPYSIQEIVFFYRACYGLYRQILAERPDIIVAPLRGADPIVKTIRLIASLERKSSSIPTIVYPRTGEQHRVPEKRQYTHVPPIYEESMTISQKRRELEDMIQRAVDKRNGRGVTTVFLIDEAFSGGSVSQHYHLLDDLIQQKKWNMKLRAFSVVTKHEKVASKSSAYTRLVKEGRITEFEVPWLFTTDSPLFLYPLIAPRSTLLSRIRRRVIRPKVKLSLQAMEGRAQLFADIQDIWREHTSSKTSYRHLRLNKKVTRGIRRLPLQKPR